MQIVSHRARGFDRYENSLRAIRNAFSLGVKAVEFDVRYTADNFPVIWHNCTIAVKGLKTPPVIAENTFEQLNNIISSAAPNFSLCSFEQLLNCALQFPGVQLWIDIKETGSEEKLVQLIKAKGLAESVVIVSWLPEVLRAFSELMPGVPLCFSHLPVTGLTKIIKPFIRWRLRESGYNAPAQIQIGTNILCFNNYNRNCVTQTRGIDYEHILFSPVAGDLLELLKYSGGYICVQRGLINTLLMDYYNKNGVKVVLYSVTSQNNLQSNFSRYQPAGVLSDSREISLLNRIG